MTNLCSAVRPPVPRGLPFTADEYSERRNHVRAAMSARDIDILYVTSPANLFYLTGYEAIWYPNRLPLGFAIARDRPEIVFFDWARHEAYVTTRVLCDEIVLFDYGSAPQSVAAAFKERGWNHQAVAIEWCSLNPAAPVMSELARLLEQAGCSLVSGDWIVDQVRLYKSAAEVERVRRAAAMADSAMLQLQKDLRTGMTELEVSAHFNSLLAQRGSEVAAMAPLVNSGPTAWADTHAFPSKRRLESGDVVTVDCCAVVDRYHVNLGRSFALGKPNARAAEILALAADSVLVLQQLARLGEGPEKYSASTCSLRSPMRAFSN